MAHIGEKVACGSCGDFGSVTRCGCGGIERGVANGDRGLGHKAVQECLILRHQVQGLWATQRQHAEERLLTEDR